MTQGAHAGLRFRDFDFPIAPDSFPTEPRSLEEAELVVVDARKGTIAFDRLERITSYFGPDDVLVWNDTGISRSRLVGMAASGQAVDVCFLFPLEEGGRWEVVVLAEADPPREGAFQLANGAIAGRFLGKTQDFDGPYWVQKDRYRGYRGHVFIEQDAAALAGVLAKAGLFMHPWYANLNRLDERELNPSVTRRTGAVLLSEPARRFTPQMHARLREQGVESVTVSLAMSFSWRQSTPDMLLADFRMNPESFAVSAEAARGLQDARSRGKRLVPIGTSCVRVLESLPTPPVATSGTTDVFIAPGTALQLSDGLMTNLHNPMGTHVIMAAAIGGRELVIEACRQAAARGLKFGIHGDSMLVFGTA